MRPTRVWHSRRCGGVLARLCAPWPLVHVPRGGAYGALCVVSLGRLACEAACKPVSVSAPAAPSHAIERRMLQASRRCARALGLGSVQVECIRMHTNLVCHEAFNRFTKCNFELRRQGTSLGSDGIITADSKVRRSAATEQAVRMDCRTAVTNAHASTRCVALCVALSPRASRIIPPLWWAERHVRARSISG
jgi:hypothetical protein